MILILVIVLVIPNYYFFDLIWIIDTHSEILIASFLLLFIIYIFLQIVQVLGLACILMPSSDVLICNHLTALYDTWFLYNINVICVTFLDVLFRVCVCVCMCVSVCVCMCVCV